MPLLAREQYADFLRGKAFRASVVCQAESSVDHRTSHGNLSRFHVALRKDARVVGPDSESEEPESGQRELQLVVGRSAIPFSDPAAVAVLQCLEQQRPELVSVHELCTRARDTAESPFPLATSSGAPDDVANDPAERCQRFLLNALAAGAIEAVLSPPQVTGTISQRPIVSSLARFQAQSGNRISNQLRESIRLSNIQCFIASLLDGTRDCDQLAQALRQAIESGTVAPGPFEHAENEIELVANSLEVLRRAGMFIA